MGAEMTEQEAVIDKVRKLLALGESPNEAEAAVAISKARSMLEKYNLSMEDITAPKEVLEAVVRMATRVSDPESWEALLLSDLANINFCTIIFLQHNRETVAAIAGKPVNIIGTREMYNYLARAIDRIAQEREEQTEPFRMGMVASLLHRIRELHKEAVDSTALVQYNREENEQALKNMFGNLDRAKRKMPDMESDAFARGVGAGYTVGLHDQINGNVKRQEIGG